MTITSEDLENISQEDIDILNESLDNALDISKTLFATLVGHGLHTTFKAPGLFGNSVSLLKARLIETDRCGDDLIESGDQSLGNNSISFYINRYGS